MIMALKFLGGLAMEYVRDWRAEKENTRKVKKAVADNRARLAEEKQSHNSAWEMAALEGRDKWLRRFSFGLFTFPLIWAGIDPVGAKEYFTNALAALPEWYTWVYMSMMAAIWGITELKQWKAR